MKLLCLGHSLVADRQRLFYEHIRSRGHEVKLLTPDFGGRVRNLQGIVDEYKPEVIRVEDEKDGVAIQVPQLKTDAKRVLFSWENLPHMQHLPEHVLRSYDLIVPGCPGALTLLKSRHLGNVHEEFIPQVGVARELFKPSDIPKEFDTCTSAGFTVNKGIGLIESMVKEMKLKQLWLGKQRKFDVLPYQGFPSYGYWPGYLPYTDLPQWYNKTKVHVLASMDTPVWTEQNAPYSNLEALLCGLRVVATDAGDIPNFLEGCPGVEIVPQGFKTELKETIRNALAHGGSNLEGRKWVNEHYSNEVVARELVEALVG